MGHVWPTAGNAGFNGTGVDDGAFGEVWGRREKVTGALGEGRMFGSRYVVECYGNDWGCVYALNRGKVRNSSFFFSWILGKFSSTYIQLSGNL